MLSGSDPRSLPPIAKGVFLVASPILFDPNFRETVILICEHGPEGTLGVIVNRPTDLPLSEVLPHLPVLKGTSYVLFAGGPVQPEEILMLFRISETPADLKPVMEGIYLGGNLRLLERVITQPQPTETFRAFAGYAGWAPGQLEYELATGSWAIVPADSMSLFDKDPTDLWPDLLERLQAPGVVRLHENLVSRWQEDR
ncbi:MAG: YqgE/AlgH family protein [Nitrospira sp.]|nr:YqgE/AlgH family protein [Nitrospira sp.]